MKALKLLSLIALALNLSACGLGEMFKMPEKMDQTIEGMKTTNQNIKKTNYSVHKQTLLVAEKEMFEPENSKYLFPPTGMLAPGQAFAEEATALELAKITYVWLKEINTQLPDDSEKEPSGRFPNEVVSKMDHRKMVKLTALQVIAGLTPQETVEQLVEEQIVKGGRYEESAYAFLTARSLFIKGFMLDEGIFATPITNIGLLTEGVERVKNLEYLVKLPFVSKINLKVTGFLNKDLNFLEQIDPNMTVAMWKRLDKAADTELTPENASNPALEDLKKTIKSHRSSLY